MAFPSATTISTANLDSSADDPSLARADLKSAVDALNDIIDSENTANGVLVLDSNGKITSAMVPTTLAVTGTQTLAPSTGVVKIDDLMRLPTQTLAQLGTNHASPQAGDVVALSDGNAGAFGLAVYNGTAWKVISTGATAATS